ncbi:MAG: sigma-70 family RNA polymerase sigma factor [Planctomycetota bacterium]|nr:sigma-70 family RNA polymerase sigma factor [Planctomycetota bacterium]
MGSVPPTLSEGYSVGPGTLGGRPSPREVTLLLDRLGQGDQKAASELLPIVYEELRKLARSRMEKEPSGQTLQPTALVHEAFLRLVGNEDQRKWDNRGHFFAAAARSMRRILVERARHRGRIKHGGGRARVDLGDAAAVVNPEGTDLVALDEVLDALEKQDPRKAEVVMLRYFGGLSIEETANAMGLSPATVKNEWMFARAWLHREMEKKAEGQ